MSLSPQAVEDKCNQVAALVAAFERDHRLQDLGEAQSGIDELRDWYRRERQAVSPFLERVKQLAEAVRRGLTAEEDGLAAEYVELQARERELAARCQAVRAALVELCRLRGAPQVRLAAGLLHAKRFMTVKLPASATPERAELTRLLQEAGLYEELTTIVTSRLQRAIAGQKVTGGLLDELKRLCPSSTSYRLSSQPQPASSLDEMLGPEPE